MNFQLQNALRSNNQSLTQKMRMQLLGTLNNKVESYDRIESPKLSRQQSLNLTESLGLSQEDNRLVPESTDQNQVLRDRIRFDRHKKYVIPRDHLAKRLFDSLMILLIFCSLISSLYLLAFHSLSQPVEAFDFFVWVMFIIDFILNFFSEYIDKRRNRIRNLKMISERYLKSYFLLDLIALIPLRYAGHPDAEYILRLTRIAKINKIFDFIYNIQVIEFLASLVYKAECLDKKELRFKLSMMISMLVQVLKMLFATYFLACLWYSFTDYISNEKNEPNSFIENFNLKVDSTEKRFVKTWYYIFTTLVTVGYGDFYATNKYEMGFAIILVLAGTSWFAFMMGSTIRIIQEYASGMSNDFQRTALKIWFSSIEKMHNSIPNDLKENISNHFLNLWKNDRLDTIFNDSDESNFDPFRSSNPFFDSLPNKYKQELLDYLFSDVFYTYKVFFNAVGDLKYVICRFMQPKMYQRGEFILKANENVNEMLFLTQGTVLVSILDPNCPPLDDPSKKINFKNYILASMKLKQEFIIGDYYILTNTKPQVYYYAHTNVKCYTIPAFVINELKKLNLSRFRSHIQQSHKIYEEIDKFYQESSKINIESLGFENLLKTENPHIFLETFDLIPNDDDDILDKNDCIIQKEICNISRIVKDSNSCRRVLLTDLKEKIIKLAMKNMSCRS
jgi:hypothetical protein